MSYKDDERYFDSIQKVKYRCKNCGRKAIIPANTSKQVCDWCGMNVYKNDKDEFKDRLGSCIKRGGRSHETKINR